MADHLPAVPSKARAVRLFKNMDLDLRYGDLIAAAYYYTNKELDTRDKDYRVKHGLRQRPGSSNIVTKWIGEAVKNQCLAHHILPSVGRRIFDIFRYNNFKNKKGVDPQSVRSLRSLIMSDHHAPKMVTIPQGATLEQLAQYSGKSWGRVPDAIWAALLPHVKEKGRDMTVLRWIMQHFGRSTEESAYGLVSDIRHVGAKIKDILENHQEKTDELIAYAEDEIQKILEAEGDASGPAKKVKAPSKKRRRAPVKATKAAVQKAPKTALNRPVRSTRSTTKAATDLSAASEDETDTEIEVARQPMLAPTSSPQSSPPPMSLPAPAFTTTSSSIARPAAPLLPPLSLPPPAIAAPSLSTSPPAAPSPAVHLQNSILAWSGHLGLRLEDGLGVHVEDTTAFYGYIDQHIGKIFRVRGPNIFLAYMLACLVEWVLYQPQQSRRPLQYLYHAAVAFVTTALDSEQVFLKFHDTVVQQSDHAQAFFYLLYGLYFKGTIDPMGLNSVHLTHIVINFGNVVERKTLDWFLKFSQEEGSLPQHIDSATKRDIMLLALKKWLETPQPQHGIMRYFMDSVPKVFCLAIGDANWALSPRCNKNLVESTAKLAHAVRVLDEMTASDFANAHGFTQQLIDECEKMDGTYLWCYIGLFYAEFEMQDWAEHSKLATAVSEKHEWDEAGRIFMAATKAWLGAWAEEEEHDGFMQHISKALTE